MKRNNIQRAAGLTQWRWVVPVLGVAVLALTAFASAQAPTSTITTTYTYNKDGAVTRVVRQVDDEAPEVTEFAWDNFVADPDNPSEGTVALGNGNLLGVGPSAGSLTQSFSYDLADRLRSYAEGDETISYGYHPTWLLAESTQGSSGDSFHFYYDQSSNPRVTNIEQSSTGEVSSRLGPLRALSDGTQQVLLAPRKDVSGVYDPELETFSAYHYDPYGAEVEGSEEESSGDGGYDLEENPFRYAEEYRDPTWGGYYLRARWYMPDFQTFLTRDPFPSLNRYGYTEGNPIVRADPSGQKSIYHGYENTVGKGLGKALKALGHNKIGGPFARVFLGPVMGAMGFVADPVGFFESMGRNYGINAAVLAGAVILEVVTDQVEFSALTYREAFGVRLVGDVVSGVANSAIGATRGNLHHFNKRTFYDGLEYSLGGVFYTRFVGARGYRPKYMSLDQVIDEWDRVRNDLGNDDEVLVFRLRRGVRNSTSASLLSAGAGNTSSAGLIGEALDLGLYHDSVLAISQTRIYFTEVTERGLTSIVRDILPQRAALEGEIQDLPLGAPEVISLGKGNRTDFEVAFRENPLHARLNGSELAAGFGTVAQGFDSYFVFFRNCQNHASAVIRGLTLRQ